ncbi:MAG: hypothetical protein HC877_15155 [Thioploca sp.]|nr:hypothetical protein [Thioploca sp.]
MPIIISQEQIKIFSQIQLEHYKAELVKYLEGKDKQFLRLSSQEKTDFVNRSVTYAINQFKLESKNSISYYTLFCWYSRFFDEEILSSSEIFLAREDISDFEKALKLKQLLQDNIGEN